MRRQLVSVRRGPLIIPPINSQPTPLAATTMHNVNPVRQIDEHREFV